MRIVSQNRTVSIDFSNTFLERFDNCIYCLNVSSAENRNRALLGEYETNERAAEVFEEIHKKYDFDIPVIESDQEFTLKELDEEFRKGGNLFLLKDAHQNIECIDNIIYYMPED